MDRRVLAAIGIIVTAALMLAIVACIVLYTRDPDDESFVMAMSMLSMGIMLFLLIFAVAYGRGGSTSELYSERYLGICPSCGSRLGEDGICPGCGRRRSRGSRRIG